jgi:toxin YoeB
MAHNITFSPDAWADYLYWQSEDKRTLKRINKLLQELQRDGAVRGIGKSEILRREKGMSKRIDKENRLEYTVENDGIVVLSCRGHYED